MNITKLPRVQWYNKITHPSEAGAQGRSLLATRAKNEFEKCPPWVNILEGNFLRRLPLFSNFAALPPGLAI